MKLTLLFKFVNIKQYLLWTLKMFIILFCLAFPRCILYMWGINCFFKIDFVPGTPIDKAIKKC